jgi:SAM-dependent methyltransferase
LGFLQLCHYVLDKFSNREAMTVGREQAEAPGLSDLERLYVRVFGYPALGLRVRAKTILPLIRSLPEPARILDAGCGKGVFTFASARIFPQALVIGTDSSLELVERNTILAERLGTKNIQFETQDLTQLEALEAYDLIIATDVLEHVDDDRGLLSRFFYALQRGGHLVLHVPHVTRHVLGWSRLNFTEIEGHVRPGYSLDDLLQMLIETGFEVKEAFYNYNSLDTLMNDISYLITEGHERRKLLYALCFPWLLLGNWLANSIRPLKGSGLVVLAKRSLMRERNDGQVES